MRPTITYSVSYYENTIRVFPGDANDHGKAGRDAWAFCEALRIHMVRNGMGRPLKVTVSETYTPTWLTEAIAAVDAKEKA